MFKTSFSPSSGGSIGNVLNFVSQMLTNEQQKDLMQQQMDYNSRESEMQRRFVLQQWERENAYNTPFAQIDRLRAAGINPALAYSQGSLDNTAAPSGGSSEAQIGGTPHLSAPQVDPLTAAQIRNLDSQTEKNLSQAEETSTLLPFKAQNMQQNNRLISQQVQLLGAEEKDIYKQWTFKQASLDIDNKTADAQIKLWNEQAGLTADMKLKNHEEYRQLVALYSLRKQGMELANEDLEAKIGVNVAEANRLRRMLSYIDSEEYKNYATGDASLINAAANSSNASVNLFMAEFDATLKQQQAELAATQAEWLPFSTVGHYGESVFMPKSARKSGAKIGGRLGRR